MKDEGSVMSEKEKLIFEIMYLGYLVNKRTDFCVFVSYSGHVDSVSVRIASSKLDYNNEIASTEFYDEDNQDGFIGDNNFIGDNKWIKSKKNHLENILKDNDIDFSQMEEVRKYTTTYYF